MQSLFFMLVVLILAEICVITLGVAISGKRFRVAVIAFFSLAICAALLYWSSN